MTTTTESLVPNQKVWYVETQNRIAWSARKMDVQYYQVLSKYKGRMDFRETTLEAMKALIETTDKRVMYV